MAKVECELITQDAIDVEIGGGLGSVLQFKSVEITENGTAVVKPDDGFDGLQVVEINTNTPENITGAIGVPDGMSLAHLLCSTAANDVTEIVDDNTGWTMTKALLTFPNLKKLYLGCESVIGRFSIVSDSTTEEVTILAKHVEAGSGKHPPSFFTGSALKKINAPYMETFYIPGNDAGFVRGCGNLEEINAPMLRDIISGYINTAFLCLSQPQLRRLVLGTITGRQAIMCGDSGKGVRPKLIHLELGEGTNVSLTSLQYWNPSYILSDNPTGTDLIEEGSTAANNLEQFLSNFKTYIANRLTDKGTGLTLTLSQEVRNAIHAAEDEYGIENIIITQKGWTISPAPN